MCCLTGDMSPKVWEQGSASAGLLTLQRLEQTSGMLLPLIDRKGFDFFKGNYKA